MRRTGARLHAAPMALRDVGYDGQAQAATAGQFAGAPEALKQVGQVGVLHAGAIVFQFQHALRRKVAVPALQSRNLASNSVTYALP